MTTALGADGRLCLEQAASLFSQQVWCWGRDIVRPEGNWLIEVGFERLEPPAEREDCPSIYQQVHEDGRRIVLRGFGMFYGDSAQGGVFLPRYEFQPQYTRHAKLDRDPWVKDDLPGLKKPTSSNRPRCAALMLDLMNWIWQYEMRIIEQLGVDYRRSTLLEWETGSRTVVPAEDMAAAWRELSFRVASDFDSLLR